MPNLDEMMIIMQNSRWLAAMTSRQVQDIAWRRLGEGVAATALGHTDVQN